MFPVTDFNFVVCGIATFAATVGYACTRRLAADPLAIANNNPDLLESIIIPQAHTGKAGPELSRKDSTRPMEDASTTPGVKQNSESSTPRVSPAPSTTRRSSLKRKRTNDEEEEQINAGYPYNLALIYPPKKRSRTPSSEDDDHTEEMVIEPGHVSTSDNSASVHVDSVDDSATPPTPPATPPQPPSPKFNDIPRALSQNSALPILMSPPKTPLLSRANTANAFTAFSGSTSPFAALNGSPYPSLKSGKPAWNLSEKVSASFGPNEVTLDGVISDGTAKGEKDSTKTRHVLSAAAVIRAPTVERITGEENEDVELELKGVKLFVKRGEKPFSGGMVGHVKLLSNKTTLDERLLFRREPLWKVSMNVRMHPTVRCTYDEEENAVRLVLKEAIEEAGVPQQDWKGEVVVYALKPGRACTKQDFKDFASSLVAATGLKPR